MSEPIITVEKGLIVKFSSLGSSPSKPSEQELEIAFVRLFKWKDKLQKKIESLEEDIEESNKKESEFDDFKEKFDEKVKIEVALKIQSLFEEHIKLMNKIFDLRR